MKTSKEKRKTSRKKKEQILIKKQPLKIKITTATDIGKRVYQEDRFVSTALERPEIWVLAVFDGHGGDKCSEFCASKIVEILNDSLRIKKEIKNVRLDKILQTALTNLCKLWDRNVLGTDSNVAKIYKSQKSRDEFYKNVDYEKHLKNGGDSGTTVIVTLIDLRRRKVVFGNCGDSRAVALLAEKSSFVSTADHVVPLRLDVNNFKVNISDGRVESDLAMSHSFGDHTKTLSGVISRKVDITMVDVSKGARLIVGSDGLFDIYSNSEVFVNGENAQQLIDRKRDEVDDNITVIVADLII
jgi:serine/threonine protein phosphatase PrpC